MQFSCEFCETPQLFDSRDGAGPFANISDGKICNNRLLLQNSPYWMFARGRGYGSVKGILNDQLTFTCSKSKLEILEKGMNYVQS